MYSKKSKYIVIPSTITQLLDKLGNLLYTSELIIDSRKIIPGSIFCAYKGHATDGRKFIPEAIKLQAEYILWQKDQDYTQLNANVANFGIVDLIQYVGILAAAKYQYPSKKCNTIGVTGTNGKTSVTHWLNQVYLLLQKKPAIVGTIGNGIYPNLDVSQLTTPDPIFLQKLLASFTNEAIDFVAMEVSSIALDQGRTNGINFTSAIFTNLTQDHLDYHGTMENYYLAKRSLFYWQDLKYAIINIDDQYGLRLYNEMKRDNLPVKLLSYGLKNGDLQATDLVIDASGMNFNLKYQNQVEKVEVKLIGKFNLYNILAVVGNLLLEEYTLAKIAEILPYLKPVCGRMDALIYDKLPLVVIDYAHTPDALTNALITLREIKHNGKLYCIFGCGGNRDTTKRPLMGKIAVNLADVAIITSDNPRYENSKQIIQDIVAGINDQTNYIIVEDRKNAIESIIAKAEYGDIVLIAGKGHETYQEINGQKNNFSDFLIAQCALEFKKCT